MKEVERPSTKPVQNNEHAGLLGLTVAITGKEIDMDTIQILDPAPFGKIANWMMQGLAESVKTQTLDLDVFKTAGWVQEDGSLLVRLIHKSAVNDEFRIPKGKWCLASAEALNRASMNTNTPEAADLVKQLAALAVDMQAKELKKPLKPTASDIEELVDSIFIVIGREPAGVHFLNCVAQDHPYLSDVADAADAWIADGSKYFTIRLDRKKGMGVPKIEFAAGESELMRVLSDQTTNTAHIGRTGLSTVGVNEATQQIAYDYWASKGGNAVLWKLH